nr:MAG TPA: hypothetical protein [Caudoviricetes sp.]
MPPFVSDFSRRLSRRCERELRSLHPPKVTAGYRPPFQWFFLASQARPASGVLPHTLSGAIQASVKTLAKSPRKIDYRLQFQKFCFAKF